MTLETKLIYNTCVSARTGGFECRPAHQGSSSLLLLGDSSRGLLKLVAVAGEGRGAQQQKLSFSLLRKKESFSTATARAFLYFP